MTSRGIAAPSTCIISTILGNILNTADVPLSNKETHKTNLQIDFGRIQRINKFYFVLHFTAQAATSGEHELTKFA